MSNIQTESIRKARMEAAMDKIRSEEPDVQGKALLFAVEQEDEETAAEIARKIRNRLLAESDAEVALDRLGLQAPTGESFAAWLTFLKKMGQALAGEWAEYRQALRDLPQSEGWPLNIVWPNSPGQNKEKPGE